MRAAGAVHAVDAVHAVHAPIPVRLTAGAVRAAGAVDAVDAVHAPIPVRRAPSSAGRNVGGWGRAAQAG